MVIMCSTILELYNMESTKREFEVHGALRGGDLTRGEEVLAVDQMK